MFPGNNFQPISHLFNAFQRLTFSGVTNAPKPLPPVTQVQPSPDYTDINKIERIINNNIERMINANMKKMITMMTE